MPATCAGPLIAIALFEGFGDAWTLPELRIVLAAGVALCAPPALLLLKLRDVRSPDDVADDDPGAGAAKPRRSPLGAPRYVILASDLVSGFGSGMTVKFVPLFFKNRVGFSPVATNALYVASPLFMMAGSRACGRLSREALGRPPKEKARSAREASKHLSFPPTHTKSRRIVELYGFSSHLGSCNGQYGTPKGDPSPWAPIFREISSRCARPDFRKKIYER